MSATDKLYEELGRAFGVQVRIEEQDGAALNERHMLERREMSDRHNAELAQHNQRSNKNRDRIDVLKEAIRLTEGGMDPIQAKLVAAEHLEDHKAKESEELLDKATTYQTVNSLAKSTAPLGNIQWAYARAGAWPPASSQYYNDII